MRVTKPTESDDAVKRAFEEAVARGEDRMDAVGRALETYQQLHPEVPEQEAYFEVKDLAEQGEVGPK